MFGPLGVTNIRTFIDPQNPTRVAVSMDVADMDKLMAVMQSPQGAEAMDHDGVVPETLVILVGKRSSAAGGRRGATWRSCSSMTESP